MLNRWRDSGPLSSSSATAAAISGDESDDDGGDRMAENEVEAAEVLASLANSVAAREYCNGSAHTASAKRPGTEAKASPQRVKIDSAVVDSDFNPVKSVPAPLAFDLNEEQIVTPEEELENRCDSTDAVKLEKPMEGVELVASSASNPILNGGCKSRYNMTEDEKEARRLRRVMANRESARQTIRRRQALCEELTQKALGLAWENEKLKRDKELAMEEYRSLQDINRNVKEQIVQRSSEVRLNQGSSMSANVSTCPLSKHQFFTCIWPSSFKPSNVNLSQSPQLSAFSIGASSSVAVPVNPPSHEAQSSAFTNSTRSPSCFLAMPIPPNTEHGHPCFLGKDKEDAASIPENCFPVDAKQEVITSTDSEVVYRLGVFAIKPESYAEASSSSVSVAHHHHHHLREPSINHGIKKLGDSAAAAEARKRRKELTKLKNLHPRESRIRC
ncbi:hypothetical protein Dimus_034736 [Dionaea muscipula]